MAKYEFSKDTPKHEISLTSESEIFTNCSQISVTRLVCGERVENYKNIYKGESQVLPAGDYEFVCMDSCADCWVCMPESLPDSIVIEQDFCIIN